MTMISSRHPASGGEKLHTFAVINGENWKARRIKNNNVRQNCRQLAKTFRPGNANCRLVEEIREPCLRLCQSIEQNSTLFEKGIAIRRWVQAILRISAYHRNWIREPEAWQPDRDNSAEAQFFSLVEHIFCRYPVPAFLANTWFRRGLLQQEERDWFCAIGQGASLRNILCQRGALTARSAHLLWQAPRHYSISKAIRWAQLKAMGASDELIHCVVRSDLVNRFHQDKTWLPLFEKMVACCDFQPSDLFAVLDLYDYEIANGRNLCLQGRGLNEIINSARRSTGALLALGRQYGYHVSEADLRNPVLREQILGLPKMNWASHPDIERSWCTKRNGEMWQVTELTTQQELLDEGKRMHHCISSWGFQCVSGKFHVFTLRRWKQESRAWVSHATIAVTPDGCIHDVRSNCNSAVNRAEQTIVDIWSEEEPTRR